MKKKLKGIGPVVINAVVSVSMLFFSLLSPYRYEWDDTIKQMDADKLLVLRFFWVSALLLITLIIIACRPKRKIILLWSVLLLLIALVKSVLLFGI